MGRLNSALWSSLTRLGKIARLFKLVPIKKPSAYVTPEGCVLHEGILYRVFNGNYQSASKITGEPVWSDRTYFHVEVCVRVKLLQLAAAARQM
jgi:hypothetical protein